MARLIECTPEAYHRDPCERPSLSASIATTLVTRSPLHAWAAHPRLGGHRPAPTKEMDLGTLVHAIVLGKGDHIAVVSGYQDWKRKGAQDARKQARAEGKVAVLERHVTAAKRIADAITGELEGAGIVLDGISEAVIEWEEPSPRGPVLCRGMVDHLSAISGRVIDLKTCADASVDAFDRAVISHGHDIQAVAYARAVEALDPTLAGRVEVLFVVAETELPYATFVGRPSGEMREYGTRRWERAVATWAECTAQGKWPGYEPERWLGVPAWALAREEGAVG